MTTTHRSTIMAPVSIAPAATFNELFAALVSVSCIIESIEGACRLAP
jgi:hypothetical protein